jgi:tRNA-dihydrouridine synthase B
MAGVTDAPFRYLTLQHGADYAVSEMVTSQINLWNSTKTQRRLKTHFVENPKIIQIAGGSTEVMIEAARHCALNGATAIEINMGCPAKKVCQAAAGSSLLKNENLVQQILSETVKSVEIPVYLKTRLGWDSEHKNIEKIAQIAEDSGIQLLTIHGRTRDQRYNGEASYELIKTVKQQLKIPVFANGDITNPEKALQVLEQTGCDGLYIGRGALGQPWLFQQIRAYLSSGKYELVHDKLQIKNIMLEHFQLIHQHYGEYIGVRIARKHFKWYLQANSLLSADANNDFAKFSVIENSPEQLNFLRAL